MFLGAPPFILLFPDIKKKPSVEEENNREENRSEIILSAWLRVTLPLLPNLRLLYGTSQTPLWPKLYKNLKRSVASQTETEKQRQKYSSSSAQQINYRTFKMLTITYLTPDHKMSKVFPIQRVFLASVKKEGKHQKQFKVFQYIHEYI